MLLQVRQLSKTYGQEAMAQQVLRDVTFDLQAGGTLALEGESGSGKSTVLHLIAGLDKPSGGQILLDGRDITVLGDAESAEVRRGTVGLVFQQFNLIPSLTVAANIAFHARLSQKHDPEHAEYLAHKLGLGDHLQKYPEALSGGQQQRVAIARTLAAVPRLILADEPTGNLDEASADRVLDLLLETASEAGSAVLMVTHSARQAARMGNRLTLSAGQTVVRERLKAGGT
ncbi:ABC transporter ATP-binding protein [uncultured Roseobacter sp.]|uniref:ABC transporter ATP-binding protein n=1 Tax=uncultured Roseobacter sp. TaxID=114847 RepID=UPI00263923F8|nr:ABC transporter ATP-binding protein [uncultured Roseobacter sp.]